MVPNDEDPIGSEAARLTNLAVKTVLAFRLQQYSPSDINILARERFQARAKASAILRARLAALARRRAQFVSYTHVFRGCTMALIC